MKKANVQLFILAVFFAAFNFTSCKSKTKNTTDTQATTNTVDTSTASTAAPVTISSDDELKKGVADATKDYPNVKADVTDSVINLTGEIKRADWQKLNPTLNSLHPKRVNSANLTIK